MTGRSIGLILVALISVFVGVPLAIGACAGPPQTVVVGLATTKVHALLDSETQDQMISEAEDRLEEMAPTGAFAFRITPVAPNGRGIERSTERGFLDRERVPSVSSARRLLRESMERRFNSDQDYVTSDLDAWWTKVVDSLPEAAAVMIVGSPASRSEGLNMYEWGSPQDADAARQRGASDGQDEDCRGTSLGILGAGNAFDPGTDGPFETVPPQLYDNSEIYWRARLQACGGSLAWAVPFP